MRFKFVIICLFAVFAACGPLEEKKPFFEKQGVIGVNYARSLYNGNAQTNTTAFYFMDKITDSISEFVVSPLAFRRRVSSLTGVKKVLAHPQGRYSIALVEHGYQVNSPIGTTVSKENAFVGILKSSAFDPLQNILVLQDENRSISISIFNDDGTLKSTWLGGPRIADNDIVNAGSLISNQRLVVSLGLGKIALINLTESVASQQWKYELIEVPQTKTMSWIAPIPKLSDGIFIGDENQLLTFDVVQKTVLSRTDLTNYKSLGQFSEGEPHITGQTTQVLAEVSEGLVIYSDTNPMKILVWSATNEGQIKMTEYGLPAQKFLNSWLNSDANELALVGCGKDCNSDATDTYIDGTLYRFRMSDGLLANKITSKGPAQWGYLGNSVLLFYPSVLGYAECYSLQDGRQTVQTLRMYNKDYLSK